jgi:hypothetical protein
MATACALLLPGGWLAHFIAIDAPASSTLTQQRTGWRPVQPALIPDLDQGHYFDV